MLYLFAAISVFWTSCREVLDVFTRSEGVEDLLLVCLGELVLVACLDELVRCVDEQDRVVLLRLLEHDDAGRDALPKKRSGGSWMTAST